MRKTAVKGVCVCYFDASAEASCSELPPLVKEGTWLLLTSNTSCPLNNKWGLNSFLLLLLLGFKSKKITF